MINPDENTLRAIITLNKKSDTNWSTFYSWIKESYLREGMNTNEIDNADQTAIAKGAVRQLRQLVSIIDSAENMLIRQEEAIKKAAVQ